MSYDDICGMSCFHTRWKCEITNMEVVTHIEVGNIFFDGVRKCVRQAGDFKGVSVLLKNTTAFNAFGFTVEVDRNHRSDLGFVIHGKEIDVQGKTGERVVLNGFEENGTNAFTFDIEVDQNAVGRTVSEQLSEGFCIHFQVFSLHTTTVNHGWKPAFTAHLLEFT